MNGKGSKPRNCFSRQFKENYDKIFRRQECLNQKCKNCGGTGMDSRGEICPHYVSCPCKKCSPFSL